MLFAYSINCNKNSFNIFISATNVTHIKIKHLQTCLNICIELTDIIDLIADKKLEIAESETTPPETTPTNEITFKNTYSLLNLVRQRLQYVLRILTKLCLTKPPPTKDCPKLAEIYKACYVLTFQLVDGLDFVALVEKLRSVLSEIPVKLDEFKSVT